MTTVANSPRTASVAAQVQGVLARAPWSIPSHKKLALLALATLLMKSLIFPPIGLWPISFVCLAPWLVMVIGAERSRWAYVYSYLWASVFFLFNVRWLIPATGAGYIAISFYLAVYFPLIAYALRHAGRRRGWSLAIVFPFLWVGGELLRAVVITGFPWFFLSHSVHRVLPLIQISDITGAYGVSFLIASVNGLVADLVLARLRPATMRPTPGFLSTKLGTFTTIAFLLATLGYGFWQMNRDTSSPGPRIAIVQGDFLSTVDPDLLPMHEQFKEYEKKDHYLNMMKAASEHEPDLYLLPESPWYMCLNSEERELTPLSRASYRVLQEHATQHNAWIVTGSATRQQTPFDLHVKQKVYNSASVFNPAGGEPGRYDKVHLVPFGEYVPFRFGRFRFLYLWINQLMPFSGSDGTDEYSMFPGDGFHVFDMTAPSQSNRAFRFGIPICYEDVTPYVSREFVYGGDGRKRCDFLLNISNDGWFGRGVQQPQHLAISVFRAVENRVGIARSVNTGGSAFIDPNGRIRDTVIGDLQKRWPGISGYSVANVMVDARQTIYTRFGDWFAWGCALAWLAVVVDYWWCRARGHDARAVSKH